MQLLWTGCSHI